MRETLEALLVRYASEHTHSFEEFDRIEVNSVGREKETPLHMACTRGALADVVTLVEGGAYVNARTDIGCTPLMRAAASQNGEMVGFLLENWANPFLTDDYDGTAITYSQLRGGEKSRQTREVLEAYMLKTPTLSPEDVEQILASWSKVGEGKSVGYLPLRTVEKLLKIDQAWIKDYCSQRGLRFKVFHANETCIESGAIYVWSETQLSAVLKKAAHECNVDLSTDEFVDKIARKWFSNHDPIINMIHTAFGDLQ